MIWLMKTQGIREERHQGRHDLSPQLMLALLLTNAKHVSSRQAASSLLASLPYLLLTHVQIESHAFVCSRFILQSDIIRLSIVPSMMVEGVSSSLVKPRQNPGNQYVQYCLGSGETTKTVTTTIGRGQAPSFRGRYLGERGAHVGTGVSLANHTRQGKRETPVRGSHPHAWRLGQVRTGVSRLGVSR
jgi:hypothetical protein